MIFKACVIILLFLIFVYAAGLYIELRKLSDALKSAIRALHTVIKSEYGE